ncbi:MAG: hypothetical protein NZM42_14305 [Gemmatales bacterium]|nr:hypothetical protein [Gemmatales bacterium]MDW8224296.1 hypothetical protein [Gemmatales bacterium]
MDFIARVCRFGLPVLVLVGGSLLSCRPGPATADPDQAREALQKTLEAWQQGNLPDSLKNANPPVIITEPQWSQGKRLIKYELINSGEPCGHDWKIAVRLWLRAPDGSIAQESGIYVIGTHPRIVIVRSEDP